MSRRALIIVLSGHATGNTVCCSGIFAALRARDISAGRAAEVLQEMGVLADDRRPSFEGWLERKLDGLADGIGREAGAWLRTMRDGPRSRPRSLETVWRHMNNVRPALLDWSQRYDHLREVTRDDVYAGHPGRPARDAPVQLPGLASVTVRLLQEERNGLPQPGQRHQASPPGPRASPASSREPKGRDDP